MLSIFAKALLVLTAFAPILLTGAFVAYRKAQFLPWGLLCLVVAILLAIVCKALLKTSATQLEVLPLKLAGIKTAEAEIVGYVLSYLLPLANLGSGSLDPAVLVFVALVFLAIVATSHSYHFNPLMNMLGYHFYEATDTTGVSYVLITTRSLRSARGVAKVVQVSEYLLLDTER